MEDKPSRTAKKVAMNILALGAKDAMRDVLPKGIIDATAGLLVQSGAAGAKEVQWTMTKRMVRIYEAFDWMMPGQFEAFAHRKAFCQREVKEGIKQGARQVLVLGAGYDTLAWRLAPEYPGVSFFEIDHPATSRLKERGIKKMGRRDNHIIIAKDLGRERLVDVMAGHDKWDKKAKSVIIAEGLLMYLPPESVGDLLCQSRLVCGPESRFAFSYIPSGEDGRISAGPWTNMMLWMLRIFGEPWLWSIRPRHLEGFIQNYGWELSPGQDTRLYGLEHYISSRRVTYTEGLEEKMNTYGIIKEKTNVSVATGNKQATGAI